MAPASLTFSCEHAGQLPRAWRRGSRRVLRPAPVYTNAWEARSASPMVLIRLGRPRALPPPARGTPPKSWTASWWTWSWRARNLQRYVGRGARPGRATGGQSSWSLVGPSATPARRTGEAISMQEPRWGIGDISVRRLQGAPTGGLNALAQDSSTSWSLPENSRCRCATAGTAHGQSLRSIAQPACPSAVRLRSPLAACPVVASAKPDASPAPLCLLSLLTWGQDNPETDVGARQPRAAAAAVRRPAKSGDAVEAAAANHADRARRRPLRINRTPTGIKVIPILAILPDTPMHVIQAPWVG